MFLVYRFVLLV